MSQGIRCVHCSHPMLGIHNYAIRTRHDECGGVAINEPELVKERMLMVEDMEKNSESDLTDYTGEVNL